MRRFLSSHRHVRHRAGDSRVVGDRQGAATLVVESRRVVEALVAEGVRAHLVEEILVEENRRAVGEVHGRQGEGIIIVRHRSRIRVEGIIGRRRSRIRGIARSRGGHRLDDLRLGDRRSGGVRRKIVRRIASGETTGDICITTIGGTLDTSTLRRDLGL